LTDNHHVHVEAANVNDLPRFPVRWRWTLFVGLAVSVAVVVLTLIVLDMERDAWLVNQEMQAGVQVSRLGDELKIPMLAGSSAEVDFIMNNFLDKLPYVQAVFFQNTAEHVWHVGSKEIKEQSIQSMLLDVSLEEVATRLPSKTLWFAKRVTYAGSDVAIVAVRYSEEAWDLIASKLLQRMLFAALLVIVFSSMWVYWLAGRMSKPLEELAMAAYHVSDGNYSHRLTITGNDELSDAASQFNQMLDELQHKEEMRTVLGRYLNPELVTDVFEGNGSNSLLNRKQEVTILFADMVAFTAFSEASETEEVVEVLNQYFEVFHRIIDYYGGHVDKYIGDAVMAVFNQPKQDEQHARNATMAAVAMTEACKKLSVLRKDGERVSFRVGLNCGEVIVGNIGAAERLEYTVIGDAVNVASRMGGLGEGNEVVMPISTFEEIGEGFLFHDMGDIQVKGVSEPLRCGAVKINNDVLIHDMCSAVALAFDMTLPTDARMVIGDVQ